MTVELVVFFNIVMLFICSIFYSIKSNRFLGVFFLLLSSFLTALYAIQRDFNYGDTLNYVNFYRFDHSYLEFEPIFDFIARIFIHIFPQDPIYFLFFCAMLTSSLLFLAYKNIVGLHSSYMVYWILLSTFSLHYVLFEVIRQGISVSFLILAISYLIKDNNWIKYYIFLTFAIGFHYSAIPFILLPLIFIINKEYYYYLIFIVIGLCGKFIMAKMGDLIGIGNIVNKLEIYSEMTSESKTILLRNFMLISIAPVIYRISRSRAYFNFYFLYIMLLAITLGMDEVNRRYLFIGPIFLIPIFWDYFKIKKISLLFLIYIFVYFYLFLINYWSMYGILNYKPLFDLI